VPLLTELERTRWAGVSIKMALLAELAGSRVLRHFSGSRKPKKSVVSRDSFDKGRDSD
jgi:hypothetical protein